MNDEIISFVRLDFARLSLSCNVLIEALFHLMVVFFPLFCFCFPGLQRWSVAQRNVSATPDLSYGQWLWCAREEERGSAEPDKRYVCAIVYFENISSLSLAWSLFSALTCAECFALKSAI